MYIDARHIHATTTATERVSATSNTYLFLCVVMTWTTRIHPPTPQGQYLVAGECQNLKALRLVLLVQAVHAYIYACVRGAYTTTNTHHHDKHDLGHVRQIFATHTHIYIYFDIYNMHTKVYDAAVQPLCVYTSILRFGCLHTRQVPCSSGPLDLIYSRHSPRAPLYL